LNVLIYISALLWRQPFAPANVLLEMRSLESFIKLRRIRSVLI
jgi:hypothetical protein